MDVIAELQQRFPEVTFTVQETKDDVPTVWVDASDLREVLCYLKRETDRPYRMLYDLTAVDERARRTSSQQPACDFSVVYQ